MCRYMQIRATCYPATWLYDLMAAGHISVDQILGIYGSTRISAAYKRPKFTQFHILPDFVFEEL